MIPSLLAPLKMFAIECAGGGGFFGLPHWYKYICARGGGDFKIPQDVPLVLLALVDIFLRIAGIAALVFVVYGAVIYVTSQGEPDKVSQARGTIINALVGVVIATIAIAVVAFLGNRVG